MKQSAAQTSQHNQTTQTTQTVRIVLAYEFTVTAEQPLRTKAQRRLAESKIIDFIQKKQAASCLLTVRSLWTVQRGHNGHAKTQASLRTFDFTSTFNPGNNSAPSPDSGTDGDGSRGHGQESP